MVNRANRFLFGFCTITFSELGWLCSSLLSPNKFVWVLSIPIMLFIAMVGAYMTTAYVDQE